MKLTLAVLVAALTLAAAPQSGDPFRVKGEPSLPPGPQITPYLQHQVQEAWRQDQARTAEFAAIRNEADVRRVQARVRERLLPAPGGLPQVKTALNARTTGRVQLSGYHIENFIFESLPGVYVTANLYVPDSPAAPKPAVLVPCEPFHERQNLLSVCLSQAGETLAGGRVHPLIRKAVPGRPRPGLSRFRQRQEAASRRHTR